MTDNLKCYVCEISINIKVPYIEEEVTEWKTETEGKSFTNFYHKACFERSRR